MRGFSGTISGFQVNPHAFAELMGYKIIKNYSLTDTIQRRKHKKKRINKKWAKRYGYYQVPKKDVYVMSNTIIGHPETLKHLDRLQ